jgi:hypothetical protein
MKIIVVLFLIFLSSNGISQTLNYKDEFGDKYDFALQFLKQNDSLFKKYTIAFNLNPKVVKAIIFPELIRYNSVYDAIEINTLKFLYIKKGAYYGDFSVGYFQMKPSFAEKIEIDANSFLDNNFLKTIGFDYYNKDYQSETNRQQRLIRITNLESQLKYLIVFIKICDLKFKNHNFKTEIEKVKLYATAYNSGYYKSIGFLNKKLNSKSFYTGKIMKSSLYNYADISANYFENH